MTAAADGDRAAVEPLFEALWPAAAAFATRLLGGDRVLAEDCAQDALVALFGQLARFEAGRDGLTWALTHVAWQCRTARRRTARAAARAAGSDHDGANEHTGEPAIDGRALAEQRDLVRAALAQIDRLAAADAEIIMASLIDDEVLREALAPATFRKRLERALARLRTAWRERHGSI